MKFEFNIRADPTKNTHVKVQQLKVELTPNHNNLFVFIASSPNIIAQLVW